jgi:hypothetical protein
MVPGGSGGFAACRRGRISGRTTEPRGAPPKPCVPRHPNRRAERKLTTSERAYYLTETAHREVSTEQGRFISVS